MAGRKTKLNKGIINKICSGIKKGYSYKRALQEAGIPERTFYHWKKQAEIELKNGESSGLLLHLLESIAWAENQFEMKRYESVRRAILSKQNKTKTVVRFYEDKYGRSVKEIIEETILPNTAVPKMIFSRKHPDEYGTIGRKQIENTKIRNRK